MSTLWDKAFNVKIGKNIENKGVDIGKRGWFWVRVLVRTVYCIVNKVFNFFFKH